MEYSIHYLTDKPQHLNACAAWNYGRWGVQRPGFTWEMSVNIFKGSAQKGACPLTLVVENAKGLPIAMGSLFSEDGDTWPELNPWISSLYTLYRYRGRGIARALVARLEAEAVAMGHGQVFLHSGTAAGYYTNLGYTAIETIPTENTAAGKLTVFKKTF